MVVQRGDQGLAITGRDQEIAPVAGDLALGLKPFSDGFAGMVRTEGERIGFGLAHDGSFAELHHSICDSFAIANESCRQAGDRANLSRTDAETIDMSPDNLIATAAVFPVTDLESSIRWYVDRLGFNPPGDDATKFKFAILQRDGAAIMLKQADSAPEPNRHFTPGLDLFDAYIWVRDIEAVKQELIARDATLVEGPVEQIYGCTEIALHDPDGYRIVFGYCP